MKLLVQLIRTFYLICTIIIRTIVCFPIDFDVWIIQTFCLICANYLGSIVFCFISVSS